MSFALVAAPGLSASPIDAAAAFHAAVVPQVRAALAAGDVVLAFDHSDHTHAAWRLAAVQELAREGAPRRVNAVAGPEGGEREAVLAFLARAPGVTGQVLQVAGNPASSA